MVDLEAELASGPIGPDTLRLPGAPARLRSASQGLQDLVGVVDRVGQRLRQANPQGEAPGKVLRALSHVAQRAGAVLDDDTHTLRELADALDHESEVLRDAQSGTLPELRSRWHAARVDLAEAVATDARQSSDEVTGHATGGHGSGHGAHGARVVAEPLGTAHEQKPHDALQLARDIDNQVLDEYEHMFRHWLGDTFREPGGAHSAQAMLVGGALEEGIRRYRHTVRGILESWADAVRRVEHTDQQVATKLPHQPKAQATAHLVQFHEAGGQQQNGVSSPTEIQQLAQELQEARSGLSHAANRLDAIRLDIRGGRMLPHGERIGSNDGFRRDWEAHFDDLRDTLTAVGHRSDEVLNRIRHLEEESAQDIRRAGRADG
ncbi:hypothetical protein [Marmoricola endophyticus]|uniref:hypothetical protein n=1 Tax=Marmoricola endophyticus TaxID=2040280 RepID=UPI001669D89A|nr:hypothetical protein [Marmoricola endophyticus]